MNDTQPELIYDVVIIGGGPAGSTAGIYTRGQTFIQNQGGKI